MKALSITAVILLLTGCAASQDTPPTPEVSRIENCKIASMQEIAGLFDRWNQSLQTGDASKVVANYADDSLLLPTVSNKPRLTVAEKEDYFRYFLKSGPSGKIDSRHIQIGCNTAIDSGLYTFTFAQSGETVKARYTYTYQWNGARWLITSHHSSINPENT